MSKAKPTLNEQIAELQAIVEWFEQDNLDVEQAIKQFEKGQALSDDIREQLSKLENTITVLKKRFDE